MAVARRNGCSDPIGLDAARRHGIAQLLTISQPDSARPPRTGLVHAAFNGFDEIMPT